MLLRSSSAPILGSCFSPADVVKEGDHDGFSQISHKLPAAQPAPFSSCPSPVSVRSRRASRDFEKDLFSLPRMRKAQSENDLVGLASGVANKSAASSLMSAAAGESEGAAGSCSLLHRQWTKRLSSCGRGLSLDRNDAIWEECESDSEPEEDSEIGTSAETSPPSYHLRRNFVAPEEQHLTVSADLVSSLPPVSGSERLVNGFLLGDGEFYTSVATNASGQLMVCNSKGCRPMTESEKLNSMLMASGLELGMGGGSDGRDGSRGQNGGFGGDSNSTEAYYQRLLQADPQNSLFLRNYAQYLSEAKHEYKKSEEYYERAILACPSDGDVLSKYAKHVWDVHKDHERAEFYYDQAVKAAPEDSYVLASHASFLWDSEDEEGDLSLISDLPVLQFASSGPPSVVASA